jgi:putative ABC transport system permease protein
MGEARFYMSLFGIFAGIALLLAVVGVYGVMSYFVSERTHEIGIRVALGAFPSDVVSLVGKLGLKLTLLGVAIGIGLAIALTRLIAQFLVGVKPIDPVTYAVVALSLVGVSLLACYLPARRASKVDPMVALRYE